MHRSHFVIDALPRTGSTSLARILACHPEISCLIEPFHPARYRGLYHREAKDITSLRRILDLIWLRWTGIKHVWQVPGQWPFENDSPLNEEIVLHAPFVIAIERQNHLQRYVSSVISRKLQFWIGPRQEFLQRLEHSGFPELEATTTLQVINAERVAMERRRRILANHQNAIHVTYESIFGEGTSQEKQLSQVNFLLSSMGYFPLRTEDLLTSEWKEATDPKISKWNTREVYERIPGIRRLEDHVGSDENGWLLR